MHRLGRRYEVSDVPAKGVLFIAIALVCVGVLILVGIEKFQFAALRRSEKPSPVANSVLDQRARERLPRLRDAAESNAEQIQQIDRYSWVDPTHGVARVPVSRAMEALIRRGSIQEIDRIFEGKRNER